MKRILAFSIILVLGCSKTDCCSEPFDGIKILFVGNSLTYSNEMPQLLERVGEENGLTLSTDCLCYPNYGLEDHINDGKVDDYLSEGNYDFLIFQQGPSSQAYGRETLFEFGKTLVELALQNDTRAGYLMVWPSRTYYQTFDGVVKNHTEAALANEAMLFSVGSIWQKLNIEYPEYELYGPDEFHPSVLGSILEVVVILKGIEPNLDLLNLQGKTLKSQFQNEDQMSEFLILVNEYLNSL